MVSRRTTKPGSKQLRHTLLGLLHIPLDDVGLGNADILGQLNSTLAAASELKAVRISTQHPTNMSELTAPMTRTLGERPDAFLPASRDSFTDWMSRSWLA